MNESFEQYQKRNTPGPENTSTTASNPMQAMQQANWLPWPRKDLAKGAKSPTRTATHTRSFRTTKVGKRKKS